ncbi:MAG: CvpA family protein [Acidobacteria bacterium]|jgi:membrane protein required for colicin V production|nr:CvpA family protein [Acidobacteriota bacterium]
MSGELNILDLLFIVILFLSLFFGIFRGLVRELFSLLFLVAALAGAFFYYRDAGLLLNGLVGNRGLADFAGFLLILALVAAAGALFTALVSKHVVPGPLKAIDRLLGAAFGLLRGILLTGLVIYGFLAFPLNREPLDRSLLAPALTRVLAAGIQVLPPSLRARLKVIEIHDSKKNNRTSRAI